MFALYTNQARGHFHDKSRSEKNSYRGFLPFATLILGPEKSRSSQKSHKENDGSNKIISA